MTELKWWRLQAKLTQRQAAARLRIGESTYGFLESGRMRPSPAQLERLRYVFGEDAARMLDPVPERAEAKA